MPGAMLSMALTTYMQGRAEYVQRQAELESTKKMLPNGVIQKPCRKCGRLEQTASHLTCDGCGVIK